MQGDDPHKTFVKFVKRFTLDLDMHQGKRICNIVNDIAEDHDTAALVRHCVSLGASLGMLVDTFCDFHYNRCPEPFWMRRDFAGRAA